MSTHARHREPSGMLRRILQVFTHAFGSALQAMSGGQSKVAPERPTPAPKEFRP